jgi:hypothetical protein
MGIALIYGPRGRPIDGDIAGPHNRRLELAATYGLADDGEPPGSPIA